jgi:hypothetical protein
VGLAVLRRRFTALELATIRHLVGVRRQELIAEADRRRWMKSPDTRKHPRAKA